MKKALDREASKAGVIIENVNNSLNEVVFQEIEVYELENYIEKEIMINLLNGEQYFGLLRDIDEDELILTRSDSEVSLGFQLSWIRNCYVKEEDL